MALHRVRSNLGVPASGSDDALLSISPSVLVLRTQEYVSPAKRSGLSFTVSGAGPALQAKASRPNSWDTWQSLLSLISTLLVAALLLLGLHYFLYRPAHHAQQPTRYTVYIDGGSSGTRIHVFQYRTSPWPQYVKLQLPELTLSEEPGLSSYATNPELAGKSLLPLLEFAYGQVPIRLWAETPVRLMATAGLRLLTEGQAEAILRSCADVLAASSFSFQDSWVGVLGGDMEGLYGWAAANYVTGALQAAAHHHSTGRRQAVQDGQFSGVLEMGGASMQLTFLPPAKSLPDQYASILPLPGVHSRLYTHSYLGLGMDAALLRAATIVLQAQPQSPTVMDPCLPVGYIADDGRLGNASFPACLQVALQVVPPLNCSGHSHHRHHRSRCTLEGSYIPTLTGSFVALENFYWTAKALSLPPTATLRQLLAAAERYCATHWSSLQAQFSGHFPDHYLIRYCFGAAYIFTLLHEGFGIGLDEERLIFTNTIEHSETGQVVGLNWVLGAVVVETMRHTRHSSAGFLGREQVGSLGEVHAAGDGPGSRWQVLMAVAVVGILLACVLLLMALWRPGLFPTWPPWRRRRISSSGNAGGVGSLLSSGRSAISVSEVASVSMVSGLAVTGGVFDSDGGLVRRMPSSVALRVADSPPSSPRRNASVRTLVREDLNTS